MKIFICLFLSTCITNAYQIQQNDSSHGLLKRQLQLTEAIPTNNEKKSTNPTEISTTVETITTTSTTTEKIDDQITPQKPASTTSPESDIQTTPDLEAVVMIGSEISVTSTLTSTSTSTTSISSSQINSSTKTSTVEVQTTSSSQIVLNTYTSTTTTSNISSLSTFSAPIGPTTTSKKSPTTTTKTKKQKQTETTTTEIFTTTTTNDPILIPITITSTWFINGTPQTKVIIKLPTQNPIVSPTNTDSTDPQQTSESKSVSVIIGSSIGGLCLIVAAVGLSIYRFKGAGKKAIAATGSLLGSSLPPQSPKPPPIEFGEIPLFVGRSQEYVGYQHHPSLDGGNSGDGQYAYEVVEYGYPTYVANGYENGGEGYVDLSNQNERGEQYVNYPPDLGNQNEFPLDYSNNHHNLDDGHVYQVTDA